MRAQAPLELLDAALFTVRRGGGAQLVWAWVGGLPLALLAITIYSLERVEGVRSLRPLFALALVLAFVARSVVCSRVARGYALTVRPSLPVADALPARLDVAVTALVVGFGLWVWLWPLAGMALVAPLAVAAPWPFVALRGAVAPSWLARASCANERGFAAFGQAFDDTAGMRGSFMLVELLTLCGMLIAFVNAYALLALAMLLAHSLLGLEVAFVSSFLSTDNAFVLLVVSAFTVVIFEPLRAAISAQAFVVARSRRDGADLHAAVDAAIASSLPRARLVQRGSLPPSAAALYLLASLSGAAAVARAQSSEPPVEDEPAFVQEDTAADRQVRDHVGDILGRREFREFAERDTGWLGELFERFAQWLKSLGHEDEEKPEEREPPGFQLPPISPWVLIAILALALGVIALYAGSRTRAGPRAPTASANGAELLAAEPLTLIDDAAAHAARGDMRAALRALYLATLASLDRGRLIEFEPSKTNWQYIRAMPRGEARKLFADFTLIFDRKWYGHEPANADDYAACRRLAEQIGTVVPS
ncbi:MAG TPA: DUF4129 domain-containing protein [Polyangiales bacterium]|nr:DUF4129 domain-containing protein [Polyangiales bacterium]